MKLLESTKSKMTKNENDENALNLEITKVALVHCNIVNNNYQQIQEPCVHLFQINHLVNY